MQENITFRLIVQQWVRNLPPHVPISIWRTGEETVFPKCTKLTVVYYRYLDNIWGIWEHGEESFEEFIQILNDHHRLIKVKATTNKTAINFLNTTVFKGPNFNTTQQLDSKVYFKETDTHALLHHKSFHPKHTFEGIVQAQLLRFSRICTREDDFQDAKQTLQIPPYQGILKIGI